MKGIVNGWVRQQMISANVRAADAVNPMITEPQERGLNLWNRVQMRIAVALR